MQKPAENRHSGHPELLQEAIDRDVRQLLLHLDSQEAAMLAVRSLLRDMATESLATTDRRKLKTRLEAAVDLTRRLGAERTGILARISAHFPETKEPLRLRDLSWVVSADLRPAIAAARRRLTHLATELSRQSATVRIIHGEERRINSAAYQLATGMTGSERYDETGLKSVQPAPVHVNVRS